MRPRSVHLHGFTTFRSMEEPLSFEDADLFALTGATGAGKTTLLDAMCFALYGKVPRLPGNAVEPVISLGALEARISFGFSVGERRYVAARVVRRTKTGATTPEARLEDHTDPDLPVTLAVGAAEVDQEVTTLLGLGFEHFTRAVMIPQGEFAAFLHDTPARRQDLLRTLLDLGVYERMRQGAQDRKARAEGEAAQLARTLDDLSDATPDAEAAAELAAKALDELVEVVRRAVPELDDLDRELADTRARIEATTAALTRLEAVAPPPDLPALATTLAVAVEAVAAAEAEMATAEATATEADGALAGLGPEAALIDLTNAWQRHAELTARRQEGAGVTVEAEREAVMAEEALGTAVEAVEVAEVALRVVEAEHAAHTLAGSLAVGRDCPVCLRPVERVPDHPTPPGLEEAARRLERAREGLVEAEGRNAAAATRLASCRATLAQVDDDLATIETVLEGRPDATAAERLRLEHTRAAEAAAEARAGERTRRAALDEARRLLDHRRIEEASARKRFTAERDRLADLGPPEPGQDDLAEDWRAFAVWAGEAARERRITLTSLETAAAGLVERAAAAHHDLTVRIEAAGVSVGGEPLEGVVRAAAEARQRVEAIRADRARAETTSQRLAVVRRAGEVARAMAGHLSARGFESWLMEEAMVALVDGANRLLAELCGEAYSLRADTREFQVVDHRNADEIRGVKTLSGGETFLVSLALALSLAEHIGSHAPAGIARLESIFLDEGFGTLDAESLETVAAVIQELGASGRTVGIVTHVKELAEMVPVRFEVTRNPSGSVVRRVET